jgi:hypothetical protein
MESVCRKGANCEGEPAKASEFGTVSHLDLDPNSFASVTDFEIQLKPSGCLGLHLDLASRSLGPLAGFPWWDDVDADLATWTLKNVPLGTLESPFDDCEQGWQILIWESDGWVYVAEGDEPCCETYSQTFRVGRAPYLKAWEAAIESASELRTASRSLPEALKEPLRYRRLRLQGQRLDKLDPRTRELSNLDLLDLSRNRLTQLPDLRCLTRLVTLDLTGNRFKALPDWLASLSTLRILRAAENQLTTITRLPPHLEELYLGYNRIRRLPSEIAAMTRLRVVDLSGNPGFLNR